MKDVKIVVFFIVVSLFFLTCSSNENKWNIDVSTIPVEVKITRFDLDFYGQPKEKLSEIKEKYAFLFPPKVPDSIWHKKMQDTLFLDLKKQVDSVYPNLDKQKIEIANLFKHIKYYFNDFKEPEIITLYSDWNYMRRAVFSDTLLLLTLDNFLGTENPMYKGIPQYIKQNLTPERMPVEIAKSIIESKVPLPKDKVFLHKMINEGKKMLLMDAFLPEIPDYKKIGYTKEKFKWAQENEKNIWQYFIDEKLLYKDNKSLEMRFLNIAPYSKFYSEEDMNSPGQIGIYIGWQIVRSFMQKNKVSLQQMIQMPEDEIFKLSKYKPKK